MSRILWTKDELIIALSLYFKIPFSKLVEKNPKIIVMSRILGRTPSALSMKLCNFARLDPELQKRGIKGLPAGSKSDIVVWNEFYQNFDKLSIESTKLLSKKRGLSIEQELEQNEIDFPLGKDKQQLIKVRINQYFFRQMILSSYDNQCCITGINIPTLLNASHIVPWSKDEKNRLNPHNGLCLNVIHDKAFDNGLITITPDFTIKISKVLKKAAKNNTIQNLFINYDDKPIIQPFINTPNKEFLEYHNKFVFQS